ncbi:protein GVQW3-like [Ptiloglossa arizonensis]|uniref:protein GVQW3-like n=1 Tax=Ptiloglossa arizonensis TaxID=3350558 RepID=UPI003F9F062A
MLTVAYGEATLDRSNVYRWYKMFSEGREDGNDKERAGRPSTSTTDEKMNEVEKMILANRRITVREVSEDLNISIGWCHSIFINDLGMRRVAAKFVPKLLNCDQKQLRMNIANEMLDSVRDDPNLLQRVITGDESLDEIKTASKEELERIQKNDFLKCFEDWKNRWHKCIISHGDYFEGGKIDIHE